MTAPIAPFDAGVLMLGVFMLVGCWPIGVALILWALYRHAEYVNVRREVRRQGDRRRAEVDEREIIALGKWFRS